MSHDSPERFVRHMRMPIRSVVLISMGAQSWETEVVNISATGLLAERPREWLGAPGDRCVLDLLIGKDLNIHVEANVTRMTSGHIGFAYTSIPEEKEHELWGLLGQYADNTETIPGSFSED
jgi:hypothetical protein